MKGPYNCTNILAPFPMKKEVRLMIQKVLGDICCSYCHSQRCPCKYIEYYTQELNFSKQFLDPLEMGQFERIYVMAITALSIFCCVSSMHGSVTGPTLGDRANQKQPRQLMHNIYNTNATRERESIKNANMHLLFCKPVGHIWCGEKLA